MFHQPLGFPCPNCRRDTKPLHPARPQREWAGQFPVNYYIHELLMLQKQMDKIHHEQLHNQVVNSNAAPPGLLRKPRRNLVASANLRRNTNCSNCRSKENINTKAIIECKDCSTCLCDVCDRLVHADDRFKSHIRLYTENILETRLPDLNQRKNSQVNRILESNRSDANDIFSIITDLEKILTNDKRDISTTKSKYIEQVKVIRQVLFDHIEEIVDVALDDINTSFEDQSLETDELIGKLRNSKLRKGNKRHLEGLNNNELKLCKHLVAKLLSNYSVSWSSLEPDDLITTILDMDRLCTLSLSRRRKELPCDLRRIFHNSERYAVKAGHFSVHGTDDMTRSAITSALFIEPNTIVLADYGNKCLKIHSDVGKLVGTVCLESRPWGVCQIDQNNMAVTLPLVKTVALVTRYPFGYQVNNCIKIKINCYGIAYVGGTIVVSNPISNSIHTVQRESKWNKTKRLMGNESCWQLMTLEQNDCMRTISTVNGNTSFIDIDQNGCLTPLRTHSGDVLASLLECPKGIRGFDMDDENNVYICNRETKSVVQITPSGTARTILSARHGLRQPQTVVVHKQKIFVADVNSDIIQMYNLI